MYLVDYHTHPHAHREEEISFELLREYTNRAEQIGLKELGFSDHDRLMDWINWKNMWELQKETGIDLRLGLEVDYRSGR
ncbi:MAG: PHP domain-containing protein, partial [Halanaerobiales bacterium]